MRPSRWPARIHGLAFVVVAVAVLGCAATPLQKLVIFVAGGWIAWLEWRYRPRCRSLKLARAGLDVVLADGRRLYCEAPFRCRVTAHYVSLRLPGVFGRWVPLFPDQCDADAFRRIRQALLHQ